MLNMPFSQNQLYIVFWYFVLDIFSFACTPTLTPRLTFISKGLFQLYPLYLPKVRNCIIQSFFSVGQKAIL